MLYGKALREPKLTEMRELTLESGNVTVRGEVFAVNNREIQRRGRGGALLRHDGLHGSVRVSKVLRPGHGRLGAARR